VAAITACWLDPANGGLIRVIVLAVVTAFGAARCAISAWEHARLLISDHRFLLNATGVAVLTFFVAGCGDARDGAAGGGRLCLAFFTMAGTRRAWRWRAGPIAWPWG